MEAWIRVWFCGTYATKILLIIKQFKSMQNIAAVHIDTRANVSVDRKLKKRRIAIIARQPNNYAHFKNGSFNFSRKLAYFLEVHITPIKMNTPVPHKCHLIPFL